MNQSADEQRRRALGEFIRSRRERTTPEMVGMPPSLRRRTPGLRREEIAMLSGIGVTWYTWLEQGRSINVSAQVLGAVARVLRLDDAERAHLFALAELAEQHPSPPASTVSRAVRLMLDRMEPYPAVVIGPHWEMLAANRAYLALIGDYTELPPEHHNSMLLYFTDARWRRVMGGWLDNAASLVARMRAAMAADVAAPAWRQLLSMLERHSPEFAQIWERQEVAPMESMVKTMHHEVGTIRAEVVHTWLADRRGVRLTVYTPCDDATAELYEQLRTFTPPRVARPLPTDGLLARA
ncbi:DNA-binding protein [Catellatospora sp. TT07R-123]|uniref:helix-turn-helix transcriptional regulator n=1 Tax=Catellatospora sp. TT07R-123 TaxID=2733863 RepID=UPI001B10473D|nr:helix-turn-helix transcriptional regulator [Catellatospora sp. TT07R-123]GHJ42725.1 DNA-binding protein [Catellatospora sp. TT07R-123]